MVGQDSEGSDQESCKTESPISAARERGGDESRGGQGTTGEDEDEQEETEKVKRKPGIRGPTREEIRTHDVTHLPFRAWCPHCIAGRAKDEAHHDREEELRHQWEVHFDYASPRNKTGGDHVAMLVGRSGQDRMLVAHIANEGGRS